MVDELWDLYADALIDCDVGGNLRCLHGANPDPLPAVAPIFVMTAYNPGGVDRDPARNVASEQTLERELASAGVTAWTAIGRSPDASWSEPGVAVAGLDRSEACAYGRRYGQLAVYELTDDAVHVVRCDDGEVVRTRRRRLGSSLFQRIAAAAANAARHDRTRQMREGGEGPLLPSSTMDVDRQLELLTAGAVDVISPAELRTKLQRGRPLRVKLGIDPTASDIHLGFAVVLRRLRLFQDLGHVAVLIMGDFTAMVGDPSGKSATRPQLTRQEVDAYAQTYVEQAACILDQSPGKLEVRRNSEWLGAMDMADVLRITSQVTVARMLERDDFSKRYQSGVPISLMEFLYPLLQATDSVEISADVELGGTDQLFNLIQGRHLQEHAGQEPQIVLTTPLLTGLDGEQKMSKSLGNYVGITEPPSEQFGKLMSISDEQMPAYFQYATAWPPERINEVISQLASGELLPNPAKRLLARTVVDLYHGDGAGSAAEAEFGRVFRDHDAPDEVPDVPVAGRGPQRPSRWLVAAGFATSNREAVRAVEAGSVRIDGEVAGDDRELAPAEIDGRVIQVGRRKWARILTDHAV